MTDFTDKLKAAGISHFSPSQLNRPLGSWVFMYAYLSKQQRREMKVGENAALGTSVHNLIQAVLCAGQDIEEATKMALMDFDFHPADESKDKREKFRELIPAMGEVGIDLLSERFAGAGEEKSVELYLPGIEIPIIGYVDMMADGVFCEMKTKAPRMGQVKKDGTRGWSKAPIPKEPQIDHIMQAAVYWKATDTEPNIAYITAEDGIIFDASNCDLLKKDGLEFALEEARRKALIRQNLLKISTDPKVLAGLVEPEFDHPFYWNHQFKEEAKELWKL